MTPLDWDGRTSRRQLAEAFVVSPVLLALVAGVIVWLYRGVVPTW